MKSTLASDEATPSKAFSKPLKVTRLRPSYALFTEKEIAEHHIYLTSVEEFKTAFKRLMPLGDWRRLGTS